MYSETRASEVINRLRYSSPRQTGADTESVAPSLRQDCTDYSLAVSWRTRKIPHGNKIAE